MKQCKWCGRRFNGPGVYESFLGNFIGIGSAYCSEKCRDEDRRARSDGGGTKPYRWVWWVIVLLVLFFLFHK